MGYLPGRAANMDDNQHKSEQYIAVTQVGRV